MASIEFNKEQLAFFPFHVVFKSNTDEKAALNTSSAEKRKISGFSLSWFLKDNNGTQVTEKLPARQNDWRMGATPAYKNTLLHDMIQLTKELRFRNMSKSEIMKEVIDQRLQANVKTETDDNCWMGQVKADEQKYVFSNILSK